MDDACGIGRAATSGASIGPATPRGAVAIAVNAAVENRGQQGGEEPRVWRSCCLHIDKSMCMYTTQITLILLVMAFCIAQLLRKPDCVSQTMYLSLLTLLIGLVIPSPKH